MIALEGNLAVAEAMRQIEPDVVAAYPITPQTEIVQKFAEFVANEQVRTEFVAVESEHSAISACVGAAASGCRAMTATSSQGLALMWEILYIVSTMRLPIVMPVVNRALSGNINIHCDHGDSMGARDAGWIQLYVENSQEAYDTTIQAVRIAEQTGVLLPVMVCLDGFILSHAVESLELLSDEAVKKFIGEYKPIQPLLDVDNPVTYGPIDPPEFYFEHKMQMMSAYPLAKEAVKNVGEEYGKITGRRYGFWEEYRLEDAEYGIIALGSTAGTAKDVVDVLRENGMRAGLLRLRMFRPFPNEELVEAVSHLRSLAVADRSMSFGGFGGPVFNEVSSALYQAGKQIPVVNYIYGLGGREIREDHLAGIYEQLQEIASDGRPTEAVRFLGVRE
jgi:pyruvate ferredoxin oxidoreductase alpha subunit